MESCNYWMKENGPSKNTHESDFNLCLSQSQSLILPLKLSISDFKSFLRDEFPGRQGKAGAHSHEKLYVLQ